MKSIVCILTTNDIQTRELAWLKEFCIDSVFECCGIEITQMKCIVVCIYRTPTSDITTFFRKLEQLLENLKHKTKYKVVIAGDLNIDILKDSNNSNELKRIAANNNFSLHIFCPTRKDSCLDQIISNIREAKGETHKLGLSDHETAQSVTFDAVTPAKIPKYWYCEIRDYNADNISKFRRCLGSLTWSNVFEEEDMSTAFNLFYEDFKLFYNLCFPTKNN